MGSGNTKPFPLAATPVSPTTDFIGGGYHDHFGPLRPSSSSHHSSHHHHHRHHHPSLQHQHRPSAPPSSLHQRSPSSSVAMDTFPTPPPKLLRVYTPPSPTSSSPTTLLPPPLYNSPPPNRQRAALPNNGVSNGGGGSVGGSTSPLVASPRSITSESHSLAEISCVSSLISEPEEIGEDEDEDDDEYDEDEAALGTFGEEEQHVESLRKFRTQQAIRNLLLEREVQILQAQLEELELMEREEEQQQQAFSSYSSGGGRGGGSRLGGFDAAGSLMRGYYGGYCPSSSLAELNRLYNNVLRVSPVTPPATSYQTPQFLPAVSCKNGGASGGGGGGSGAHSGATTITSTTTSAAVVPPAPMPPSPAHSASDKSCHTEPGIGRVREAKVRRLKQKQNKRRSLQHQPRAVRGTSSSGGGAAGGATGGTITAAADSAFGRLHMGLPATTGRRGRSNTDANSKGGGTASSADEKDTAGSQQQDKAGGGKWAFQQSGALPGSYRLAARRKRHRGSHIVFLDESGGSVGCRFPSSSIKKAQQQQQQQQGGSGGGGAGVAAAQEVVVAATARSVGSSSECDMVTDFLHKAGLSLLDSSASGGGGSKKANSTKSSKDSTRSTSPPFLLNNSKDISSQTPRTLAEQRSSPSSSSSPIPGLPCLHMSSDVSGGGGSTMSQPQQRGGDKQHGSSIWPSSSSSNVHNKHTGSSHSNRSSGGGAGATAAAPPPPPPSSSMAARWVEVELLLCKPIRGSADIHQTMLQTDAGLAFMDQLDLRARQLNVLRGTLARWLLPYDTNTAASEQRSVIESVLENEPDDLRGKLPQEEIQYLVQGANNVRRLIRVKIADDADLDQARRALRTAQSFFTTLMSDANGAHIEPYELLCRNARTPDTSSKSEKGDGGDRGSHTSEMMTSKGEGAQHQQQPTRRSPGFVGPD